MHGVREIGAGVAKIRFAFATPGMESTALPPGSTLSAITGPRSLPSSSNNSVPVTLRSGVPLISHGIVKAIENLHAPALLQRPWPHRNTGPASAGENVIAISSGLSPLRTTVVNQVPLRAGASARGTMVR